MNITADAGQCVGIVGTNGCGKSTLLNILAGLRKADGGEIYFDGNRAQGRQLCRLRVCRTPDGTAVAFDGVFSADGEEKAIRCSNVLFQAQYE